MYVTPSRDAVSRGEILERSEVQDRLHFFLEDFYNLKKLDISVTRIPCGNRLVGPIRISQRSGHLIFDSPLFLMNYATLPIKSSSRRITDFVPRIYAISNRWISSCRVEKYMIRPISLETSREIGCIIIFSQLQLKIMHTGEILIRRWGWIRLRERDGHVYQEEIGYLPAWTRVPVKYRISSRYTYTSYSLKALRALHNMLTQNTYKIFPVHEGNHWMCSLKK